MQLALPNVTGDVFELTPEVIEEGLKGSKESPRKRMLLPIHRRQEDLVQRMLNFFQPGTYVTPHLHPRDFASETILVIQGRLGILILEEDGEIRSTHRLKTGAMVDIEPRLWHSVVALEPDTIILEIKRGPYDDTDKVFAPWAPPEGDPRADSLLEKYTEALQA